MTLSEPVTRTDASQRSSLFLEDATILSIETYPGSQYVFRLMAPRTAARATPGSFAHIQCDPGIPMRRPLSIMRASSDDGWIEVLFKIVGDGLRAMTARQVGETVSVIGPIGQGFTANPDRPRKLLIGGGVGIPPMIFLAEQLHASPVRNDPLVIMGSEIPFPFPEAESAIVTEWLPGDINRTMPFLENLGIPVRLASQSNFKGCFKGYVTDLAREWLQTLDTGQRQTTEVFSCGPTPMLKTVTALATEFDLPCQVSLEEYMACGVGGCAGCTVMVRTNEGPAMKRVCVDGPVFAGTDVFDAEGR